MRGIGPAQCTHAGSSRARSALAATALAGPQLYILGVIEPTPPPPPALPPPVAPARPAEGVPAALLDTSARMLQPRTAPEVLLVACEAVLTEAGFQPVSGVCARTDAASAPR